MKPIILVPLRFPPALQQAQESSDEGDVTDARAIHRAEQEPQASGLRQTLVIQREKKKQLILALNATGNVEKNSYPTLVEVAPGDFRAVWDSGTADTPRTFISFGKLKLKP